MSQLPNDKYRLRRRPRAPSAGGAGVVAAGLSCGSASSSTRPSSRPRIEATENVPSLSPTVSPPALSMRERGSNTSTPPPANWQIPSCSRCIVCGRLGCEACSVKVDPEATRQKLDSLRLNTPFERAKLTRITDELLSEETRQRQRLVSRGDAWLEGLRTTELIERHLVRVILQEALYRQQLCRSEQAVRSAFVSAADQHTVLLALQSSEAAARQTTVAREREQFANFVWRCTHAAQAVHLLQREATTREALRYNESSQWHRLQATEVESRSLIAENGMARLRFHDSFLESREGICREWYTAVENLAAAAASHRELVGQHVQQRCVFLRAAEQGKRDLAAEEAATRVRLREEMTEEAEYLVECHRIFARQRATFFKSEASLRQGIREEAEGGYHVIFLDMKADEDDVREAEAQKADRRHSALLFALDALRTIQHEEHTAFEALVQEQRTDAAGRLAWRETKAAVRAALLHQCVLERETTVAAAEAAARAELRDALAQGEVGVAQWVTSKHHAREELCRNAQAALEAVAEEERQARFRLLSSMAAHEEGVRRWCEEKRVARAALFEGERAQRSFVVQQEGVCRQAVCSRFVFTTKALEDRLMQHRQERTRALSTAVDALTRIAQDEQVEFTHLRTRAAEDARRTAELFHFRCQMDLLHAETQRRALLAQDEMAARAEVHTKMLLSARYAAEAALAALRVQLCSVTTAEEGARQCFYEQVGDWYEYVAVEQRMEELALIAELEQRIREELRARQTYMTEDARLYAEEEPLALPALSNDDDARFALSTNTSGGRGGSMHDVRRALVMQTLGNPTCTAVLPAPAVDFLVAVIDRVGRQRDIAMEVFTAAERQARDASKKLMQCERVLAAEKEKREMYDVSSRREAEERERRVHGESLDKARGQQSIAAEKRRLADVQAELQEQQKKLEALKSSVHKQFSR
ncbi:hypothetical protein ABB37_01802 [Leptomonas pyrrhocoris]|uniref:Uncharacterized protein n=1 Tax=Leptomonas pyrrhocoris TaxID=157538 RepID=A0A0N0DZP2_LEPPY|nr:hypothetical protein ABB37_01802 [Leptomonas pyrrhocoris]KPA85528.1 hypothetical protein ABB37_01802 [Leptomonas pyrrhocoris]|eukprot:XP_015663967.1 hypothetical protein ABB37_01802 [Leptomonas pyrrhocoris]